MLAAIVLLTACDRGDAPLPGERIPVRPSASDLPAPDVTLSGGIALPPARSNADWSHRNGAPGGRPPHPALAPVPQLRWATPIGQGETKRSRIVAGPIVAGGLVFAMDAAGRLSAVTRSGQVAWSRSLVPEGQLPDSGPGGGLAAANGVLFVTTGFGEAMALNPATGQAYWREQFEAPIRAAPMVRDGRVVFVLRNDTAFALDAGTGATLWRVQATGGTGLLGGSVPAADGALIVVPFASGEVLGVLARNGLTLWGTAITGGRRDLARNRITDISGDPIFDGGAVYASNQSGRTIRIDRDTGAREWTMPEGSYGPAWPAGDSVFLMSDMGELVRASAAKGEIRWTVQLPQYVPGRRIFGSGVPSAAVTYYGPILAGGRLWVASGDQHLRAFNPANGALLADLDLPGGAAVAPAVAGGVMYVVTRDGRLLAFQ